MAANYLKKVGANYNFGEFVDTSTPIAAEFDKPVKVMRVPLPIGLMAGSTPEAFTWLDQGDSISFPNIAGYPNKFMFQGSNANDPCSIDVVEFGDETNEDYFKVETP